ncbi:MAG: HIT family protein [Bacteroidetes bacterium]|jgi:histidine triad (HIT) family protein|nr:MAG: HIT family protein [Bacteroidota bacterium]
MASVFSKIVAGEIPSYKVAEDAHFLAFLDIYPLTKGHTLVIPKKEVDYLFDLDDETYLGLMQFAKKVALGIQKAIPCKRLSMQVIGLEVPHAHIHLIPINSMSDCNFSNPKLQLSKEEMESIAESIRKNIVL